MAFVLLVAAIAAEIVGTSLLKTTDGFTRLWPTLGCMAAYLASAAALAQAVKSIPISIAYALWSGLGTAAIVAIAILFFHEPLTMVKAFGLILVVAGVVLLNLDGAAH